MLLWLLACEPKSPSVTTETTEDTGVDCIDEDGDGAGGCGGSNPADRDCDDHDSANYPGAEERCDGQDNDCDEQIDEGVTLTLYADADGDGFGDPATSTEACEATAGWVENADDCDDAHDMVSPDTPEVCDGIDQDCDGRIDDGVSATWYVDADGDGYGDPNTATVDCESAPDFGQVDNAEDCDDADAAVSPDARERWATAWDDDCDGTRDRASIEDADIVLLGEHEYDYVEAASAGDLDRDGHDDLVVGAFGKGGYLGAVYVLLGPLDSAAALGTADGVVVGEAAGSYFGRSVEVVPDVDGDGNGDVLVGAYRDDTAGADAGAAYLFSGPALDAPTSSDAAAALYGGGAGDEAGETLAGADLDGDGYGDLIFGVASSDQSAYDAGAASVVYGPVSGTTSIATGDLVLTGETAMDHAGSSVDAGGDLDGDGLPDLVVGAEYADAEIVNGGAAYVVYAPATGMYSLADADVRVAGTRSSGRLGSRAVVGDLDGDGADDLVASAASGDGGAIYVFTQPLPASGTDVAASVTVRGQEEYGSFGCDVSFLGESSRLVVGAQAEGDRASGIVYVFDGLSAGTWTTADAAMQWAGSEVTGGLGAHVASGDLDDDGNADVLVGQDGYNGALIDQGAVWGILAP